MNLGNVSKLIPKLKRAHNKLTKTFDGDSNDAEHDAALELSDVVIAMLAELQPKKTKAEAAREEGIRGLASGYTRDGELEVDDGAVVSEGDDNGAYVQAWLWVDFSGTEFCKGEDGSHDNCQEGCPVFDKGVADA